MSEDERAIRERLAALESEVKAEATAQKARKEAALELVQAERARRAAKAAAVEKAQAAKAAKPPAAADDDSDSILEDLAASASKRERARQAERGRKGLGNLGGVSDALELTKRAGDLKQELTAPRKKGQKSWMISAGLSTAFGPLGWLYAGSWREAAPAAAIYALGLYVANWILPFILLMPALMIALPLSGIAGAIYALGYNRSGSRQRLFGDDKPKKALKPSSDD